MKKPLNVSSWTIPLFYNHDLYSLYSDIECEAWLGERGLASAMRPMVCEYIDKIKWIYFHLVSRKCLVI